MNIGWIGTGVMGGPMCGHVIAAGHDVTVFNRTKSKAEQLGATWADTPAQVAAASDIIVTIVGYPKDVREVILGDDGVLAGAKPGATIVDMTTSEPSLAVEIYEAARSKGVASLDAPVSGGDVGAREARLAIMCGGDRDAFETVLPLLEIFGKSIKLLGGPGAGQHTKMVNQMLIAPMMIGVCEGLLYARKAGLDPLQVIEAVGGGAAGSWSINNYGPRIVRRDFEPGFYVEHFLKDMRIALAEAKEMGLTDLPGLALAEKLYRAVDGRKGTQALMLALEELSGS